MLFRVDKNIFPAKNSPTKTIFSTKENSIDAILFKNDLDPDEHILVRTYSRSGEGF